MPTKEEIFKSLDTAGNKTYSRKEVKAIVSSLVREVQKPNILKKGDVYVSHVGGKKRPVVICRVLGDIVVGIPLSTTEDALTMMPFESRFSGNHFMAKQLVTSTYEHAKDNFSGVFDNNRAINKAVRELKVFYMNVL